MRFPWAVFLLGVFCWQLMFVLISWNKDQVDSETREHCRIWFFHVIWPQNMFLIDISDNVHF